MKRIFCAGALLISLLCPARGADDLWKPFQFIIGDWVGGGSGKPGQGTGEFSLKPDLSNKILVRRNRNEYPAQAGQAKGLTHEDLMIIYPPQGSEPYRAVYFDSEGHVIHYAITASEDKIVFLSEGAPAAPRFRLTYHKKANDALDIDFAMAPPNQDFHPYLSGTVTRK
jgi:hypothetical protein